METLDGTKTKEENDHGYQQWLRYDLAEGSLTHLMASLREPMVLAKVIETCPAALSDDVNLTEIIATSSPASAIPNERSSNYLVPRNDTREDPDAKTADHATQTPYVYAAIQERVTQ